MAGFQFKQFSVRHDRCAMKVGTDSILFGAWANIDQVRSVLDMGCGSGLLALMIAQRLTQRLTESDSDYQITAIEIELNAAQQAKENAQQSPWTQRIRVVNRDLITFAANGQLRFDLIIANPPYFETGVDCRDDMRETARYINTSSGHLQWLQLAEKMLNPQGRIAFVLPYVAAENLLQQLEQTALYCNRRTEVITKQGKAPQRLLLEFSFNESAVQENQIVVYQPDNQYHPDFIALTRDFYLKL